MGGKKHGTAKGGAMNLNNLNEQERQDRLAAPLQRVGLLHSVQVWVHGAVHPHAGSMADYCGKAMTQSDANHHLWKTQAKCRDRVRLEASRSPQNRLDRVKGYLDTRNSNLGAVILDWRPLMW